MLLAIDFTNLHEILQALYQDMMPLCEKLTGVAKGIAGLGALFYIAAKVWQAIARADPLTCTRCCALSPSGCASSSFPPSSSARSTRYSRPW